MQWRTWKSTTKTHNNALWMIHIFCRKTKQTLRVFTIKRKAEYYDIVHIILTSDPTSEHHRTNILLSWSSQIQKTHLVKSLSHEMTILHFCAELFFFTIIYFPSKTAVAAQLITQINISSILTKMHPAAFQSIARRITFFLLLTMVFVCLLNCMLWIFRD